MSALITDIIAPDNFELIRDQLGAVLLLELDNQKALDPTLLIPEKVWIERFVPFNTLTETPYMNIRYHSGAQDEKSRERTQSHYLHTYFIEISAKAKSTDSVTGDQLATLIVHRLIRMVRSILSNPLYNTLGFNKPFNKRAFVNSLEVFEPMEMQDSSNQVDGRVEYCIEVPEYAATIATGAICNWIATTVKLSNTDIGYFWEFRQKTIIPTEVGDTLTDAFFSIEITELYETLSGVTYYPVAHFTQSGTTITAITFSFTEEQIFIAKT